MSLCLFCWQSSLLEERSTQIIWITMNYNEIPSFWWSFKGTHSWTKLHSENRSFYSWIKYFKRLSFLYFLNKTCVFQMQPPNTRSRLSSTVSGLKWRSTASRSAPSITPSSAPLHRDTQRGPAPDPSGPVSNDQWKRSILLCSLCRKDENVDFLFI